MSGNYTAKAKVFLSVFLLQIWCFNWFHSGFLKMLLLTTKLWNKTIKIKNTFSREGFAKCKTTWPIWHNHFGSQFRSGKTCFSLIPAGDQHSGSNLCFSKSTLSGWEFGTWSWMKSAPLWWKEPLCESLFSLSFRKETTSLILSKLHH